MICVATSTRKTPYLPVHTSTLQEPHAYSICTRSITSASLDKDASSIYTLPMDIINEIVEINRGAFKIVHGLVMSVRTYATYHDAKIDSDIDEELWLGNNIPFAIDASPIEWESRT